MEKPGDIIQDLLTKTTQQEPSSWFCKPHRREVPDYVVPIIAGRTIRRPGECPDCKTESEQTQLAKEVRDRHNAMLMSRLQAGVPKRYLNACLADFREDTPAQQLVGQQVRDFIGGGWRDSPGLLFLGKVGTGKTLLGAATVNYWLDHYGWNSARLYTALGLNRRITATWKDSSGETDVMAYQRLRDLPLLVVDEIGVQFGSPTEHTIFTEIINERYNARHPTILIGNLTITDLEAALGERVVDRFCDGGHTLSFTWSSQRGVKRS